jgi:TM2 domain-containing membrane protein YozV
MTTETTNNMNQNPQEPQEAPQAVPQPDAAQAASTANQPQQAQPGPQPPYGAQQAPGPQAAPYTQQAPNGQNQYQQAPYQQYQQPYYAQPYVTTKDHVAAGLLALFLGGLGIHKFYLGYNTAGFIMLGVAILGSLVSFGMAGAVVWVIGVVEGIIYLTKSQSEFDAEYVYSKKEWF